MPSAILISPVWKCHDGWAASVTIIRDGKQDYAAGERCRQAFPLWYRSAKTRERAEKRQAERIAVAQGIATGLPVVKEGTPEHTALFQPQNSLPHSPSLQPMPTATFTADHGITFRVRLVRQGERYGAEHCLVHDQPDPLVEFYDTRYLFDYDFHGPKADAIAAKAPVLGQFISRYHLSTLREERGPRGLVLYGGCPSWCIEADTLAQIHHWLETIHPI